MAHRLSKMLPLNYLWSNYHNPAVGKYKAVRRSVPQKRGGNMKRSWFALIGMLVLLCAAMPAVYAQETTSSIQGTVTDASGAALPGVTVDAVIEKGQRYSAV